MLSHLHCLHAEIGLEKGSNFFVENNIVQLDSFMLVSHRNEVTKMNLLVVTRLCSRTFGSSTSFNYISIKYFRHIIKYFFHVISYCASFQIVGCVGALRLNKRLLKGYWIILLCLLVGDILVGFIWLFRFDSISKGLDSDLSNRLSTEYRHNIKG